jgi:hypothetical protein
LVGDVSAVFRGMKNIATKFAKRWINKNVKNIVKEICLSEGMIHENLKIEKIRKTGHERKVISKVGETKYIFRISLKRSFKKDAEFHALARKKGVPLSETIAYGTKWISVMPIKYMIIEYVEGERCDDSYNLKKEEIKEIGKTFGKMHSIKKPKDGKKCVSMRKVAKICRESYEHIKSELNRKIENEGKEAVRWVLQSLSNMENELETRMVHGDPHGGNLIIGKKVNIIDTDSVHFGYATLEMARCLLSNYNRLNVKRQKIFIDGYRTSIDEKIWNEWQNNTKLISVISILRFAKDKVDFATRTGKKYRYEMALNFWKTFIKVSGKRESQIGGIEDIMTLYDEAGKEVT